MACFLEADHNAEGSLKFSSRVNSFTYINIFSGFSTKVSEDMKHFNVFHICMILGRARLIMLI